MTQRLRLWPTSLTLVHANVVLLVSLIAILGGSFAMAGWPTYRVLAVREVLLILLPACLVVLALKLPAHEKTRLLRLRWPGGRIAAMSALIGAGGWLVDSWLSVVFSGLLGFTTPLPPDFFPTTPGKALILLVVLAILAPICEETLFRGVIQRGYEELSPRASILAGGALFAMFHQSLPQGLALLPLAFLLGYIVWRSDSLLSGIVAHATNNALAGVLIIAATADPEIAPFVGTLPAALAGAALAATGLWGLRRWTAAPSPTAAPSSMASPEASLPLPASAGSSGSRRDVGFWLARLWPLLLIAPIVAFTVGVEAALGWFPEALALGQPVRWSDPPWDGPHTWTYEVRNALATAEEPIGRVRCSLTDEEAAYTLACSRQQLADEADTGQGVYDGGDMDETLTAHWQRPGLRLLSVDRRMQKTTVDGQTTSGESSVTLGTNIVEVTTRRDGDALQASSFPLAPSFSPLWPGRVLEPAVLESGEWLWRLSALPFGGFYSAQATMVDPDPWREDAEATVRSAHVIVYGAEPVKTPAGTFIAWHVRVGGDGLMAWYDVERPHTLVALENGVETWVLTSAE